MYEDHGVYVDVCMAVDAGHAFRPKEQLGASPQRFTPVAPLRFHEERTCAVTPVLESTGGRGRRCLGWPSDEVRASPTRGICSSGDRAY